MREGEGRSRVERRRKGERDRSRYRPEEREHQGSKRRRRDERGSGRQKQTQAGQETDLRKGSIREWVWSSRVWSSGVAARVFMRVTGGTL